LLRPGGGIGERFGLFGPQVELLTLAPVEDIFFMFGKVDVHLVAVYRTTRLFAGRGVCGDVLRGTGHVGGQVGGG